jgi:predicted dehydrogenase
VAGRPGDEKIMNVLVVGYGSIGRRHVRLLNDLGCNTALVSKHEIDYKPTYSKIECGIEAHNPEYIVVSNVTSEHHATLVKLSQLKYAGVVLVEKPLFHRLLGSGFKSFRQAYVAYNLRFHPVIQRLKSLLAGEKIISVMAYAGQYLPDWRSGQDYRKSYSASKEAGGGVLRDLSHELDYLVWLLEGWERITALGGQLSPLEITSDDVSAISIVTPRCKVVTLQMNYLDRIAQRFIIVNTAEHTITADLIKASLNIDGLVEKFDVNKDMSYRIMHKSILDGSFGVLCSFDEGLDVLRIIEAAEQSVEQKKWIEK